MQGVQPAKPLPLTVQFAHQSMPYPSSNLKRFLEVFDADCSHLDSSKPVCSLRAEAHQPQDLERDPQSDAKTLSKPPRLEAADGLICRCTE